jgi:hypothetical protein
VRERASALSVFDACQGCAPALALTDTRSGTFIARSILMMDIVMLAIGFVLFAVSIAYVYACDVL